MDLRSTIASQRNGAILSDDRRYRYVLWRDVPSIDGCRALLFVGLNPSTADESENDPTIRRCMGFAERWGYSRLLMVNLFAYRATKPKVLHDELDPVGPENDRWLRQAIDVADFTLAAWGNNGLWGDRHEQVKAMLKDPHCLGRTKQDAPRHPLYVPRNQDAIPF